MSIGTSPRAVISLHGIRTSGVWQKQFAPELAMAGLIPYALHYGYFGARLMLQPGRLDRQVEWLMAEYDRVRAISGCMRPSVVAHSFGTLQVALLLRKHRQVNFDTIILAASIVKTDFPWGELLEKNRVRWVMNEYGKKDVWPKVARLLQYAGPSGRIGFSQTHRFLHQIENPFHRHSDYFAQSHFRYNWLPTLLLDKREIIETLQYILINLERTYQLRQESLRCLVFAEQLPPDGSLKVVSGLHVGEFVTGEEELVVEFEKQGARLAPVVAFTQSREVRVGRNEIDILKTYDRIVHPRLKWAVAMPLPSKDDDHKAIGALQLEGLEENENLLPAVLMEDRTIFRALQRIGEALDPLTLVR